MIKLSQLYNIAVFFAVSTLTILIFSLCGGKNRFSRNEDLTQYIRPYIGTGGHGHVFLGANVPFGFVQLGPTNYNQGWDWSSGYHISDPTIVGFGHLHLSGTGIGDLGDISFMPAVGDVPLQKGNKEDPSSGIFSPFDRSTEKAKAGYYAVHLQKYGIGVELTATKRVGFHKYTFPQSKDAKIIIDLSHGIGWDSPTEAHIEWVSDSKIRGYRFSKGWANDQKVYFVAEFSKPMTHFSVADEKSAHSGNSLTANHVYGQIHFSTKRGEEVLVKVALSPVSMENAQLNMNKELPHWDFDDTVAQADAAWNEELKKIFITTTDEKVKNIFYTALYHTMIAPSEFFDLNGEYRGSDGKVHSGLTTPNYTTYSLWDTYRAAHPLMSIIHPEKMPGIINSMLTIYQEQGKLPVWHLMGCETDCMVGNPGINVIADAVLKDVPGIDKELACEAMKNSAMKDERGLKFLKQYGYIPYDKEPEGLSKCMEYAIADWSIAQVSKLLNKQEDYQYFLNRSKAYKHYYDKETGFMRGLSSEGKFRENFNPYESIHRDNDYTEGNAWQYTWLVPHDIIGLSKLFENNYLFVKKLNELFTTQGDLGKEASPDISGLIGQYAHGNEPSHHIAYIYSYAGQPWKTAEKVREILATMYSDTPEGLCGNEDVGQMSAWYVMSSLGLYQVEPAGGKYIIGSPIVDSAEIKVRNGTFHIHTLDNSPENKYVQFAYLNNKLYPYYYISHKDIENGGKLVLYMGDKPSPLWGLYAKEEDTPNK